MHDFEEQLFQRMFEGHSAVMLLIEPATGKIIRANRAALRFYGYSAAEMAHKRIQDINLFSENSVAQERQRALFEERNHFIFPHKLANGEQRVTEVYSSPITWKGSTILFSIIHDITDRQKVKKELQESQSRLRTLFDNAPDALFLTDVETGVIRDANVAASRLLMRAHNEIVGLHYMDLHPPELLDENQREFLEKLLSSGDSGPQQIETVTIMADGTPISIELTAEVLDFRPQRQLLSVFRDISQRREMETALKASEERLQLALESNKDGLWDRNALTNRVFFSKQWKEMLGYQGDEISDDISEWETRIHPDDKERVDADLERHITGDTASFHTEYRIRCKDGFYKWVLDRGKVISWTEDHRPLRIVGTHTDITTRKEAELENVRLVEKLKEALSKVHLLSGLLPICANCKKIRDDQGYWTQIEGYIRDHSEADFSHSICPECARKLYPEFCEDEKDTD